DQRGRGCGVAARWHMENLFAISDANAMKDFVAACDISDAVRDARRTVNVTVGFELPNDGAIACGQTIEIAIIRANQNFVADDHWRGFDLALGLECPERFAITGIDGVECA